MVPKCLCNNESFMGEFASKNFKILEYASDGLGRNVDFMLSMIAINAETFKFTHESFYRDARFIKLAMERNFVIISYIPGDSLQDPLVVVFEISEASQGIENYEISKGPKFIIKLSQDQVVTN